jgi:hypothetical protein
MMEAAVKALFDRYESVFNRAIGGDADLEALGSLYAPEFIAASPAGVMAGRNDDQMKQAMTQGYTHYREIGTQEMRIRDIRVSPVDDHHCVAHVAWRAIYARPDLPETAIDFDVHYLVQKLAEDAKVFGWISGDEQALLKERGII